MTDEQTTTAPGIEKRQFLNQSGGWEGVVVINGKGEERGISVAHGERVWLSEAEVILTAEAPQRPQDNPFEEQVRTRINPETGVREDFRVRPLVPVTDKRYVPGSERYIPPADPAALGNSAAALAATGDEPSTVLEGDGQARQEREGQVTAPPVPPRAREAVQGNLSGAEAKPAAPADEPPAPAALGGDNPSEEADAPVTPASQSAPPAEETAATQQPGVGDETGAAVAPDQPPVEGEYAQAEEVGTPDAPNAAASGPPAPWSPGSSS